MSLFGRIVCLLCLLPLLYGCGAHPSATNLLQEVKSRGYLRVGVKYDSPPFGFLEADGKLQGYEIDLAHTLAQKLLGKADAIKFVQVNSATRVAALDAQQVDFVLATMTITPERARAVTFTHPYYEAAQGILVKSDSPVLHMADLKDKTVLYVIGSTGEARLAKLLPEAHRLGFRSTLEAFTALRAGRGDAFSTDDTLLNGFLHEYCGFRLLPDRLSKEPYGIAFRKDSASQPLYQAVDQTLDQLKASAVLDKLNTQWQHPSPPANCPVART